MNDNITSNVLKFAYDTKVFRMVNNYGDKQHLQYDVDKLVKWSEKWHMLFNFRKCKCLHTVTHGNLDVNYKRRDTVLGTTASVISDTLLIAVFNIKTVFIFYVWLFFVLC